MEFQCLCFDNGLYVFSDVFVDNRLWADDLIVTVAFCDRYPGVVFTNATNQGKVIRIIGLLNDVIDEQTDISDF